MADVDEGTAVDLLADAAWACGATAVGERPADGAGRVRLEIGFTTATDAARAARELAARFPDAGAHAVDAGPALEAALDAWRAHARPERAGDHFVVWPDWLGEPDEGGDDVVVRIDPSRAFGSGSHPSTRLCLAALEPLVGPGTAVLDVGCGSGVLAVGAALLGARAVVAVDVDPVAVAATVGNAERNGVAATVVASTTPVAEVDGSFDVVLANIGAATLVDLAADLVSRLAPGATLVLAGLLADSWDHVRSAYEDLGLVVLATAELDGWSAPTLTPGR